MPCEDQTSAIESAYLSTREDENAYPDVSTRIDLVRLSEETEIGLHVKRTLSRLGWKVSEHALPLQDLEPKGTVLVLDELSATVMAEIQGREDQWLGIQHLINLDCKILWVTSGSQFEVKNPNGALIHGLARVARAENPSLVLLTLDIESGSSATGLSAIDRLLKTTQLAEPKTSIENEFAERSGIIYVSRVLPDDPINRAEKSDSSGGKPQIRSLHDASTCIRLQCERLGTMDSLQFSEVSETELLVPENFVEIEVYAAGLNFKVSAYGIAANVIPTAVSAHCILKVHT